MLSSGKKLRMILWFEGLIEFYLKHILLQFLSFSEQGIEYWAAGRMAGGLYNDL